MGGQCLFGNDVYQQFRKKKWNDISSSQNLKKLCHLSFQKSVRKPEV